MKKLLTNICASSILAISLAACSSDESFLTDSNDNTITFTTNITRASGQKWEQDDKIGVYMKIHDNTGWDGTTVVNNGANIAYVTGNGDGNFTASGTPLTYPKGTASTYDFIAYYPYSATVTNGIYKVDVSRQGNPSSIDLLYADNLKDIPSSSKVNPLAFSHKLASLVLNITATDNKDISGIKVTVTGVPTKADFNFKDASFTNIDAATNDIPMYTSGSGNKLTASAFLIPQKSIGQSGLQVKIASADGKTSQTVTLKDGNNALINSLESGKSYTVNINVKNISSSTTTSYARWMETPTITDAQLKNTRLKYITHSFTDGGKQVRNYSMLYNKDLKISYWVAYPLCNYYTTKHTNRTDKWAYDPSLPEADQADLKSGYPESRGHQIPSADRYVTRESNEQTFYSTNMTPQIQSMNSGIIAKLEDAVRSWSTGSDTLYVVTGAGFNNPDKIRYENDRNGTPVAVPDYYYKACLYITNRTTGEARTIAYKLEHKTYSNYKLDDYAISVADLEKATGFTFFPQIDAKYKASFDKSLWPHK